MMEFGIKLLTFSSQLVEQNDVVFDDGVAPELALDFDSQHISSTEALLTWAAALTGLVLFWNFVAWTDPESKNPAVGRKMNMVVEPVPRGPPNKEDIGRVVNNA
jgi:hypothetical protein